MRDYVRSVLGDSEAERILVPLLAVLDKPEDLNLDELPDQFVVKSNHGSGNNLIVKNKACFERAAFIKEASGWLKAPYGLRNHEWAYNQVDRKILVEKLLLESAGSIPADYKFCMIHGQCEFIKVYNDRFNQFTSTLYDPSWNKLNVSWRRPQAEYSPPPQCLHEMLEVAQALSKSLDFIRVDFYVLGDTFFLGELTNYPVRGRGKFAPTQFDFDLGKKWTIKSHREFQDAL
jgi:hypothetical protein